MQVPLAVELLKQRNPQFRNQELGNVPSLLAASCAFAKRTVLRKNLGSLSKAEPPRTTRPLLPHFKSGVIDEITAHGALEGLPDVWAELACGREITPGQREPPEVLVVDVPATDALHALPQRARTLDVAGAIGLLSGFAFGISAIGRTG